MKVLVGFLLAGALVACGGGGGSPGVTAGGGGVGPATPGITLRLKDNTGATITNNTVRMGAQAFLDAIVTDAAGGVVPNTIVTFTSASGTFAFAPTNQDLTDATGTATVQVVPTRAPDTDIITATATVSGTTVSVDIQMASAP